ncbi:hypothetical protein [Paenibacillus sp. J2TS4]|uniref:hypothetical protein n=1 Tax=Paenibacillus sp. J2TS4 TaxID=2807194 RepID=UPI001B2EF670|nr:hypothetical protein [Paenibacillus sp. J2TS4]GIP32881.1 hypothetical protein J2TS4_20910 [Paenibacillus sp. J2TS4]
MLSSHPNPSSRRLEQILHPNHPLCKDDVIWMLEWIKKKVAEGDPKLLDLPQPRLLKNFHYFAETAMMFIHGRPVYDQELDSIKSWLREAGYGLIDAD